MLALSSPTLPRRLALRRWLRQMRRPITLCFVLVIFPALALAQSGSSFDTGFTAIQTLVTGTVAKVASLIAIVVGGYQFAHREPGSKRSRFGYVAVSRASHEATIFTDDVMRLGQRLSSEVSKTSALEIDHVSLARNQDMGISL